MSIKRQEEFPLWPELFTNRRDFNPQAENQPYLEYLQTPNFNGEGDDHEDDWSSEEDEDISFEQEDDVEDKGREDESVEVAKNWDDGQDADASSKLSNARLFMMGFPEDDATLKYPDQVDQVADFCESSNMEKFDEILGKDLRSVALLDDSNICGTAHDYQGPWKCRGHCRPYLGPLTRQALYEELRKKRFRLDLAEDISCNGLGIMENDAQRRLIFITGLDPLTIEVLIRTAARSQAPTLRDLLYKYLTRKASLDVTIKAQGFWTFTLDFQIPYFVLRETSTLLEDTRTKPDGKPLRESRTLPSLPRYRNPSNLTDKYRLYEAQTSVAVTGIDHWVWVAYCFVDTYFETKNIVDWYDKWNGTKGRILGRTDPLAAGRIDRIQSIWTPREYFLKVVDIRTKEVLREWNGVFLRVKEEIQQSTKYHVFPLASNGARTRQEVRDFCDWNSQMMHLLRDLISALHDTVGAWEKFERSSITYFSHHGKLPNSSQVDQSVSVATIGKTFTDLKDILHKLEYLEKTLGESLNSHLNIETNEAAFFQQKAGRHIQVLTVLTIIFYPLTLNANLFSATGVLPLTPNLVHFTYVLVVLALLVGVTLAVLYKWQSCVTSFSTMADCVRKTITDYRERKAKEDESRPQASSSPSTRKWTFPGWRYREPYVYELGELERRIESREVG